MLHNIFYVQHSPCSSKKCSRIMYHGCSFCVHIALACPGSEIIWLTKSPVFLTSNNWCTAKGSASISRRNSPTLLNASEFTLLHVSIFLLFNIILSTIHSICDILHSGSTYPLKAFTTTHSCPRKQNMLHAFWLGGILKIQCFHWFLWCCNIPSTLSQCSSENYLCCFDWL